MGVYRLFTGQDGESHIEELSAEALGRDKFGWGPDELQCFPEGAGCLLGLPSSAPPKMAGRRAGPDYYRPK